jgi:hypothetical protein
MNIDSMPAGRELDALVAEKVMNYTTWAFGVPRYSESIEAAWGVLEKILDLEGKKETHLPVFSVQVSPYGCSAVLQVGAGCVKVTSNAESAPLAICRAALKVVGAGE